MPTVNHFLSLPSELYTELQEIARVRGMSMSDFVLESLMKNADAHLPLQHASTSLPYASQSGRETSRHMKHQLALSS